MLKINRVGAIVIILIVTQLTAWAQNNSNSPYTRFGYGELADRSFAAGRAMGGIGIGLRSPKQINPMNPASYSGMDSLTYIFDFGAHMQISWFTDDVEKQKNVNGNIEYLAMQFPITRRLAASIGILPYSHVGYQFGETKKVGDIAYREVFNGSGGLNEVYGGLSIDIWKKRLSLGANIGYLFGNIDHQQNVVFSSGNAMDIVRTQRIEVRDMKLDFGLQYTHPLSKTDRVTLGAVYSPANSLNAKAYNKQSVGEEGSGGYVTTDTIRKGFDLPDSYGVGFTYVKGTKLTVGADVLYEQWSSANFLDRKDDFKDRLKVAAGIEYVPDVLARSYFKKMKYRAGVHYSNSYQQISMTESEIGGPGKYGYKEYGASIGFAFPVPGFYAWETDRSFINLSLEYVKVKPELRTMIDEQYLRITLNFTFNESWFRKFKLE